MANTVIALKKSATPDAVPTDLANGELALNYADGKLYFKRANGQIGFISPPAQADSFGTVNANGTLIISDSTSDVLTITPGDGIAIIGNALTDTITISATVPNGPTGAQGIQGTTGTQGSTGFQGEQGFQGLQGTTGFQGERGFQGFQGTTGFQGERGFQGFQGTTGTQGTTGFQGTAGPSTTINATAVTANDTVFPVFVTDAGSNQTAQTSPGFTFNPSSNNLTISGSLFATSKSFVIKHPTKDGSFLRYGSLEGPENGVYVRGKLDGQSVIELPDYWWNLINERTITVNLTPYERSQDLWVQSISAYFIHLNQPATCFYTVFAERKDVDKLVVEY